MLLNLTFSLRFTVSFRCIVHSSPRAWSSAVHSMSESDVHIALRAAVSSGRIQQSFQSFNNDLQQMKETLAHCLPISAINLQQQASNRIHSKGVVTDCIEEGTEEADDVDTDKTTVRTIASFDADSTCIIRSPELSPDDEDDIVESQTNGTMLIGSPLYMRKCALSFM